MATSTRFLTFHLSPFFSPLHCLAQHLRAISSASTTTTTTTTTTTVSRTRDGRQLHVEDSPGVHELSRGPAPIWESDTHPPTAYHSAHTPNPPSGWMNSQVSPVRPLSFPSLSILVRFRTRWRSPRPSPPCRHRPSQPAAVRAKRRPTSPRPPSALRLKARALLPLLSHSWSLAISHTSIRNPCPCLALHLRDDRRAGLLSTALPAWSDLRCTASFISPA